MLSAGAIGDVLYGDIDIAINSRFIIDYETFDIDYVYPLFADLFCIIAPSALQIPQWHAIFQIFNIHVWMIILFMDLLCAYVWYLLIKLGRRKNQVKKKRITKKHHWYTTGLNVLIETSHFMASAPTKMPSTTKERIFIGSCLLVNLIIIGTFQVLFLAIVIVY